MEGSTNAQGNQSVEEIHSSTFTWRIENFPRLNVKKIYSEIFEIDGYKWRILVFPKGNNVDYLSVYLDVSDSDILPYGWSRYAQFGLSVINQIESRYTVRKGTHGYAIENFDDTDTQHDFNARESDWGFTSLIPLSELNDPGKGYLVNYTCIIEADVSVRIIVTRPSYDSKKETGFVGLDDQRATCYLNSVLQSLYHLPYFRKNLFSELQSGENAVMTKEFIEAFGWITYNSFPQHDVQEFIRTLFEKLEEKMKGTVMEGALQKLFEGHHMDFIKCVDVNYKYTRSGLFYDLQLDVKGCRDVYAALDKYVAEECLNGDNRYYAGVYGLQDAKKGVLFVDLPPILQLHLPRFGYDFIRDTMVKLNDYFEFPLQLDMDIKDRKYLSPEARRGVRNLYTLYSVLVHSGGVHGGHYSAFVRINLSHQWYKFDDERVTKVDAKEALEEQYGSREINPGHNDSPKCSSAFMLVYIRESEREKIFNGRLQIAEREKEQNKKDEAYMTVKVACDEDIKQQIGRDLYLDLVDYDKVKSFHIQRQTPFELLKEKIAIEIGVPMECQRFWLCRNNQNHTRLNGPLTRDEEAQTIGQLMEASSNAFDGELKLFLEVDLGPDLYPIPPPNKTEEDILLFFKLYDPEREELSYAGRLCVKSISKPTDIFNKLNAMAGYAPDEEIELYEEMKSGVNVVCEHMDQNSTFRSTKLVDGDIICFQRCLPLGCHLKYRYPDVRSYLECKYDCLENPLQFHEECYTVVTGVGADGQNSKS